MMVDKFADLLTQTASGEDYLIGRAQKARVVGIHLVMVTQRLSVDALIPHDALSDNKRAVLRGQTAWFEVGSSAVWHSAVIAATILRASQRSPKQMFALNACDP